MTSATRTAALSATIVGILLAASVCERAHAQQHGRWTAVEIAALPAFCQARLARNEAQLSHWNRTFGRTTVLHLHHYCYGLLHMQRANKTTNSAQRRRHFNSAVKQFDYVLRHWGPDSPLYQEVQANKSVAQAFSQ
ncbi:MAG TPA: hypothetical protein PL143_00360 [Rhodocyclaceae bacterium]|nr:hypothetical protein [Rhodocyclaceae bacterium]